MESQELTLNSYPMVLTPSSPDLWIVLDDKNAESRLS